MAKYPKTTTIGSYPVFPSQEDIDYYEKMKSKGLEKELVDPYFYTIEEVIKDFTSSGIEVVSTGQTRGDLYSIFLDPKFVKGIEWSGSEAYVNSRIERLASMRLGDVLYTKSILPEGYEIKEPITDAFTLAKFAKINTTTYSNTEELAKEINRKIVLKEIEELQNSKAVSEIQLDSPVLAAESYLPEFIGGLYEEASNTTNLPVVLHACGDTVRIFKKLCSFKVDVLSLDFYHYPRLLEEASRMDYDQGIGLGVLDSQAPRVESVELISSIIKKAKERIAEKVVFVHPHCGQRNLSRDVAFEKNVRMRIARDNIYFGEALDVSHKRFKAEPGKVGIRYLILTDRESKEIVLCLYNEKHEVFKRIRSRFAEGIANFLNEQLNDIKVDKNTMSSLLLELGRAELSLENEISTFRQRTVS